MATLPFKLNLQFFAEDDPNPPAGDPPAGDPQDPPTPPAEHDIATMLLDIQGLLANMQQTLDKLAPVEEAAAPPEDDPEEEPPAPPEEPTEDEIEDIDKLLQSE